MCPRNERKIIYCVRHAEAVHNHHEQLIEKQAKSPEAAAAAREQLLLDPQYADAPLTPAGAAQVEDSKRTLHTVLEKTAFPSPTLVLVSPLMRTLQTAVRLFPHHNNIQALELLRERRTGRPCDERKPGKVLKRTPGLERVNFDDIVARDHHSAGGFTFSAELLEVEPDLEKRARQFVEYLKGLGHTSVSIVTHKAFLRALQGVTATSVQQYGNAEVRIHDMVWTGDELEVRVHCLKDLCPPAPEAKATAPKPAAEPAPCTHPPQAKCAVVSSVNPDAASAVAECWAALGHQLGGRRPGLLVVHGAAHYARRPLAAALKHCGARYLLVGEAARADAPTKVGAKRGGGPNGPAVRALTVLGICDPKGNLPMSDGALSSHPELEPCFAAAESAKLGIPLCVPLEEVE